MTFKVTARKGRHPCSQPCEHHHVLSAYNKTISFQDFKDVKGEREEKNKVYFVCL